MLVLSRKESEQIVITTPAGEQITVMVVELRGDKVRLGIEAPSDVAVHRREVAASILREHGEIRPGVRRTELSRHMDTVSGADQPQG